MRNLNISEMEFVAGGAEKEKPAERTPGNAERVGEFLDLLFSFEFWGAVIDDAANEIYNNPTGERLENMYAQGKIGTDNKGKVIIPTDLPDPTKEPAPTPDKKKTN